MIYQCDIHDQDFKYGEEMACVTCIRILERIKQQEEIHRRNTVHPVKGLIQDIFWPAGMDRHVYEHMDHIPVAVTSKRQLRDELKKRNMIEAGRVTKKKTYWDRRRRTDYDD